jgi:hypothetical protein
MVCDGAKIDGQRYLSKREGGDSDRIRAGTRARTRGPRSQQTRPSQRSDRPRRNWLPAKCRTAWQFSRHRFIFNVDFLLPLRGRRRAIRIRTIMVGDSRTFAGVADFMHNYGVEVIDLDLQECAEMMTNFIAAHPQLGDEDIGR